MLNCAVFAAACWNAASEEGRIAIADVRKAVRDYYGSLPPFLHIFIQKKINSLTAEKS